MLTGKHIFEKNIFRNCSPFDLSRLAGPERGYFLEILHAD